MEHGSTWPYEVQRDLGTGLTISFAPRGAPRAMTRRRRARTLTVVIEDVVRAYVDLRGFQVRASVLHKASEVLREPLRIVNIR
jgi:hypothetical protein